MKKSILIFALAISITSCDKKPTTVPVKEFKTAYVDTSELMKASTEAKDIKSKYEAKAEVMGAKLKSETARFQSDAANFKQNAQANGQAWAEQKGAELQKRQQELQYAQEAMMRQLQGESGVEMDSLISKYRKSFKTYGKEKGYDYIYGTGESATVLYAKDNYDITKEMIKIMNDSYKKPATPAVKK